MLTETFTYNGAVVTVHRASVRSRLREQFVYRSFDIQDGMDFAEFVEIQAFAQFMVLTKVEGDLGFVLPSVSADRIAIQAAFEEFLALPADFYDQFITAVGKVNAAPGDPKTTPEMLEKKE